MKPKSIHIQDLYTLLTKTSMSWLISRTFLPMRETPSMYYLGITPFLKDYKTVEDEFYGYKKVYIEKNLEYGMGARYNKKSLCVPKKSQRADRYYKCFQSGQSGGHKKWIMNLYEIGEKDALYYLAYLIGGYTKITGWRYKTPCKNGVQDNGESPF